MADHRRRPAVADAQRMSDEPTVTRHEIMEERGNRDAFRLCVLVLLVVALGLVVLGVVAWNLRVMLIPLIPREKPAPQLSTPPAANGVLRARVGVPRAALSCSVVPARRDSFFPISGVVVGAGATFRPVPCHEARGFGGTHLAKAMRPVCKFPDHAAGLKTISRRDGVGSSARPITSTTSVRFRPLHPLGADTRFHLTGSSTQLDSSQRGVAVGVGRMVSAHHSRSLEQTHEDRAARSAGNLTPVMAVSTGERDDARA